jgi:putative SOS response-associated peptidase YedK
VQKDSTIKPCSPRSTATKPPAFRDVWSRGHRCLVVTDGFYEWRKTDKQPFAICTKDDLTIMAGLGSQG